MKFSENIGAYISEKWLFLSEIWKNDNQFINYCSELFNKYHKYSKVQTIFYGTYKSFRFLKMIRSKLRVGILATIISGIGLIGGVAIILVRLGGATPISILSSGVLMDYGMAGMQNGI